MLGMSDLSCLTPSIFEEHDAIRTRETHFRHQARNSTRYCTFITARAVVCVFGMGRLAYKKDLWSTLPPPAMLFGSPK